MVIWQLESRSNLVTVENTEIVKAIGSLRTDNPLGRQAEKVLADSSVSIDDLEPILSALSNASVVRKKDSLVAAWIIAHAYWTDEQQSKITAAMSTFIDEALTARRPLRLATRWVGRGVLMYIMLGLGLRCFDSFCGPSDVGILQQIILGMLFGAAFFEVPLLSWLISRDRCKLRLTRRVITALGDLAQPSSIASIASALTRKTFRDAASTALPKIARSLSSEHYGTLPSHTVPILCDALNTTNHSTILVILKALTIIGDGRAIKVVERLVYKPPTGDIGRVAADLLPILKQRQAESNSSTQLLRASENSVDGKQELLRGTSGVNADDPDQLVRASIGSADEHH